MESMHNGTQASRLLPLHLRLDAHAGCQIKDTYRKWAHMTMNEIKYAVFSANWQTSLINSNWVILLWAGYTDQNIYRHSGPEPTFPKENNWL